MAFLRLSFSLLLLSLVGLAGARDIPKGLNRGHILLTQLHGPSSGYLSSSYHMSSSSNLCELCTSVSSEIVITLSDPEFLMNAIQALNEGVCAQLAPDMAEKCMENVAMYVPMVIEAIVAKVNPDALCYETGICTRTSDPQVLASYKKATSLGSGCSACLDLVVNIKGMVQQNQTYEDIMASLHLACLHLKPFKQQCDSVVDTYTPIIVEKCLTTPPQELCELFGACSPQLSPAVTPTELTPSLTTTAGESREGGLNLGTAASGASAVTLDAADAGSPQECAACMFLVKQLQKQLEDPDTQFKILEYLVNACGKLENPSYKTECKKAVLEYLPLVFGNIDKVLDPSKVCATAKLCEIGRLLVRDNQPTTTVVAALK